MLFACALVLNLVRIKYSFIGKQQGNIYYHLLCLYKKQKRNFIPKINKKITLFLIGKKILLPYLRHYLHLHFTSTVQQVSTSSIFFFEAKSLIWLVQSLLFAPSFSSFSFQYPQVGVTCYETLYMVVFNITLNLYGISKS